MLHRLTVPVSLNGLSHGHGVCMWLFVPCWWHNFWKGPRGGAGVVTRCRGVQVPARAGRARASDSDIIQLVGSSSRRPSAAALSLSSCSPFKPMACRGWRGTSSWTCQCRAGGPAGPAAASLGHCVEYENEGRKVSVLNVGFLHGKSLSRLCHDLDKVQWCKFYSTASGTYARQMILHSFAPRGTQSKKAFETRFEYLFWTSEAQPENLKGKGQRQIQQNRCCTLLIHRIVFVYGIFSWLLNIVFE